MTELVSTECLRALAEFDSCTIENAIERFGVRLRNEGFTRSGLRSITPQLPPVVGYAETLRVRSSSPPTVGYYDRTDWWAALEALPRPRVLVLQDIDSQVGVGAFVGGVHAHVLRALGCVAAITNGAARDIPQLVDAGLHVFAGRVSPSHAYMHIVDYGEPVEVAGLKVQAGDLLHADQHGVVNVPKGIAEQIPAVAARLQEREHRIFELCRSTSFSIDGLRAIFAEPFKDESK